MRRIWFKAGEIKGFTIWRQKEFPAYCYDTTERMDEAYRKKVRTFCEYLERNAVPMEQAKKAIAMINEKLNTNT